MSKTYRKAIILCIMIGIGCVPGIALSANFRVNSTYDVNDLNPGNGLCVAYLFIFPPFVLPFCTLRGAIEETNNLPGEDTINLLAGMYRLSLAGADESNAATGDLDITDSLTIVGSGAQTTFIDGKTIDRIFDIVGKDVRVTIKNLTIINGKVTEATKGHHGGGAVRNAGSLVLKEVVLLNHTVVGDTAEDVGGLIRNSGACQIISSTLQGGSAYEGGGIYNEAGGEITITASTVSNNWARWGGGGSNYGNMQILNSTFSANGGASTFYGGGLENWGQLDMAHVTFAYNRAKKGGGLSNRGIIYLQNSIVAENEGSDCHLPRYIFSKGTNLDGDTSCGLYQKSDLSGVDPSLRPLKNHGGTTRVHMPHSRSPVYDSGLLIGSVRYDQRGVERPQGSAVDIGAVESVRFSVAPLLQTLLGD